MPGLYFYVAIGANVETFHMESAAMYYDPHVEHCCVEIIFGSLHWGGRGINLSSLRNGSRVQRTP